MLDLGFQTHDNSEYSKERIGLSSANNALGEYTIDPTKQLIEFSNEYVDAYPVMINDVLDNDLYALAFKKHYPQPINELSILNGYNGDVLQVPKAFGIVNLVTNSEGLFLVAIMKKISGKSLSLLLSKGVKLDDNFIFSKMLRPILGALNFLHQNNLVHGAINLDNIFLDETGRLQIKECISSPAGITQNIVFETIERAQSNQYAKGSGHSCNDYYALGIALYGMLHFQRIQNLGVRDMISGKLAKGTFEYLMGLSYVSGRLGELIKGLTQDNEENRYGYINIEAMLENKNHSIKFVNDGNFVSRAIIFNNRELYSKRALADELANNWDLAKEYIKTDKIIKWIGSISTEEKYVEMLTSFFHGMSSIRMTANKSISQDDERLLRLIILLDPGGPIRLKSITFMPEGLGRFICRLLNNNQADVVGVVLAILAANVFSAYEFRAAYMQDFNKISHILSLSSCIESLKRSDSYSGVERILYDLNPTLPCQHTEFKQNFIISIPDMFAALESEHLNLDEVLKKKITLTFVASKIKHNSELTNPALNHVPSFLRNIAIQSLVVIAHAQKSVRLQKLPNISSYFYLQIVDLVESLFKSNAMKEQFIERLKFASDSGVLDNMVAFIKTTELLLKDNEGFNRALRRGAEIACEIFGYNNRNMLYHDIRRKGLNAAVKVSYLFSAFALVVMLLKSF